MKFRWIVVLALMGLLVLAWPVQAGGWVVINVTEWPESATYLEPQPLRFTLLQHGQTPVQGATPVIRLTAENQPPLTVAATATEVPGEYAAEIQFPAAANWTATIQARPFPQELTLPVIVLTAPVPVAAPAPAPSALWPELMRWGAAALLLLAVASFIQERRRGTAGAVWAAGD